MKTLAERDYVTFIFTINVLSCFQLTTAVTIFSHSATMSSYSTYKRMQQISDMITVNHSWLPLPVHDHFFTTTLIIDSHNHDRKNRKNKKKLMCKTKNENCFEFNLLLDILLLLNERMQGLASIPISIRAVATKTNNQTKLQVAGI